MLYNINSKNKMKQLYNTMRKQIVTFLDPRREMVLCIQIRLSVSLRASVRPCVRDTLSLELAH